MSNEVKTKEKVDMDPKYIITLTVTLFITCVIVAGLLGLVNGVTAGPIAEINLQKTQEAMLAVVADPDNTTFSESPLENTQAMTDAASAAGGTLGILIPPSVGFIMYAIITEESLGKLFVAGVVPGLLLALLFCFGVYALARLRPDLAPRGEAHSLREKVASLWDGPILLTGHSKGAEYHM